MSKHDTWVFLISPSPYDPIKCYFPKGFPMRDPFPMSTAAMASGGELAVWIVDIERLTELQFNSFTNLLANSLGASTDEIVDEALRYGGFAMNGRWIERMEVGSEGYQRTKELGTFLESNPSPTPEAIGQFYTNQLQRWVEGDETPPPLPQTIDEVPEQLRSPELTEAIQQQRILQILAKGGYSVLDVLMGKATVDILNELDPDHQYELYRDTDDEED